MLTQPYDNASEFFGILFTTAGYGQELIEMGSLELFQVSPNGCHSDTVLNQITHYILLLENNLFFYFYYYINFYYEVSKLSNAHP